MKRESLPLSAKSAIAAADALGVHRATIYRVLKRHPELREADGSLELRKIKYALGDRDSRGWPAGQPQRETGKRAVAREATRDKAKARIKNSEAHFRPVIAEQVERILSSGRDFTLPEMRILEWVKSPAADLSAINADDRQRLQILARETIGESIELSVAMCSDDRLRALAHEVAFLSSRDREWLYSMTQEILQTAGRSPFVLR